jgi:hypothetical protein
MDEVEDEDVDDLKLQMIMEQRMINRHEHEVICLM